MQEHGNRPKKFRSYEEIKKDLSDLELLVDSEQNVVQRLINEFPETESSLKIDRLKEIGYLLHNVDNAQVFIDYSKFLSYTCIITFSIIELMYVLNLVGVD